jgi:hypothetical protein
MNLPSLHLIVLPMALLLAVPGAHTASDRGCPLRPDITVGQPDWLYLVNGQVKGTAFADVEVSAESVVSAEVICYEAVERMFDLSTRHGVYSIITTPGPLDGFHEGLEELVRRQNEHFAAHRRFASEVAELSGFQVPQHTTIELTGIADGWTATARHAMVNRVCHAYGGAVARPHEDMAQNTAKCFSEHKHGR